jgi:uncharacterized protein
MQYSEGKICRVFTIRLDDGEDLIDSISRFAREKDVISGIALFIGALKDGRAVMGPEDPVIPPVAHFETYQSAWETFGMATIYQSSNGPKLHIHSTIGRGREAMTACLREKATVYLLIEAVLIEFIGLNAKREFDEKIGSYLPVFEMSMQF